MQVYHYDPTQGNKLIGYSEADPDPLVKGEFLIPAFTTGQIPPLVPQGMRAVFDGQVWTLEADIPPVEQRIKEAPDELFGGPTLGEIYGL